MVSNGRKNFEKVDVGEQGRIAGQLRPRLISMTRLSIWKELSHGGRSTDHTTTSTGPTRLVDNAYALRSSAS